MNLGEALFEAKSILKNHEIPNFSLDVSVLAQAAFSLSKERIFFQKDFVPSESDLKKFFEFVKRRAKNEPVAYIINHKEFYGIDFYVDQNCLIPRPDSEILVEEAIKTIGDSHVKILEIGVGSGALSIAIAKNCQNCEILGVDISKKALEISDKNIKFHELGSRISLLQSDLFCEISNQKFDFLISNPPYIKKSEIEKLSENVKDFEPISALLGGEDGLDFYRKIAVKSPDFLQKNGQIFLEIGFDQKNDVIEIFEGAGFSLKMARKDYGGNDRLLVFA